MKWWTDRQKEQTYDISPNHSVKKKYKSHVNIIDSLCSRQLVFWKLDGVSLNSNPFPQFVPKRSFTPKAPIFQTVPNNNIKSTNYV